MGLACLQLVGSRISRNADLEPLKKVDFALKIWGNVTPVLLAGGFQADSAKREVEEYKDYDVMIVLGRYYISYPDLPFRIQNGLELSKYDRSTFYNADSAEGYTDQPFSKA